MTFHILAFVADLATLIRLAEGAWAFRRPALGALHYIQNRAFPRIASSPGFDARMKAIETLANLFTVLVFLSNLSLSETALVLVILFLLPKDTCPAGVVRALKAGY